VTEEATGGPARYSLMGLTIAQVEAVSKAVGLPSARWGEADQWVVMGAVYAVVEGLPIDEVKAMTVGELAMLMAGEDEEDESDPTAASD
jgi:hypothetical protein